MIFRTFWRSHSKGEIKAVRGDGASIEEQLDPFGDPTDVLGPVFRVETQIATEVMANVVAIENKGPAAPGVQAFLHRVGQGRFARAGQSGEPEIHGPVAIQSLTVSASD